MNGSENADNHIICEVAQDALTRAVEEVREIILREDDLSIAFHATTKAAQSLRDHAEMFSEMRAMIVARMAETEKLSVSKLAEKIGVSKSRAGQLVALGRRLLTEQQTED